MLKDDQYNDAEVYRVNRDTFIALSYTPEDPGIAKDPLQPLDDKQLWGKNMSFGPQLGNSKLMDPWFWYVHPRKLSKKQEQHWITRSKSFLFRPFFFAFDAAHSSPRQLPSPSRHT